MSWLFCSVGGWGEGATQQAEASGEFGLGLGKRRLRQWRGRIQVAFWICHFGYSVERLKIVALVCFAFASLLQGDDRLPSAFLHPFPLRERCLMERKRHAVKMLWRSCVSVGALAVGHSEAGRLVSRLR